MKPRSRIEIESNGWGGHVGWIWWRGERIRVESEWVVSEYHLRLDARAQLRKLRRDRLLGR